MHRGQLGWVGLNSIDPEYVANVTDAAKTQFKLTTRRHQPVLPEDGEDLPQGLEMLLEGAGEDQ